MDTQSIAQIRAALTPDTHSTVTLKADTLQSPQITDLITNTYAGKPIEIQGAEPCPEDGTDKVVIKGKSNFLNVTSDVTATFTVDTNQAPTACLKYTLPSDWTFSHSFGSLPESFDDTQDDAGTQVSYLDRLIQLGAISDCTFITTSHNTRANPDSEAPLPSGLNFVGRLGAAGLSGILSAVIGETSCILAGPIIFPTTDQEFPPLEPGSIPGSNGQPVPGIRLEAQLTAGFSVGQCHLNPSLVLYSPLGTDSPVSYAPVIAVVGDLSISENIDPITVTAAFALGSPMFVLSADTHVSLSDLADLVHIAGDGDLVSELPDQIQEMIQQGASTLGKLEISSIAVGISASTDGPAIEFGQITVAMPQVPPWKAIADYVEIHSISSTFIVYQPFDTPRRQTGVTIRGRLELLETPFNVLARAPHFFVYAEMEKERTISLSALIKQYLKPVPALPDDITIDSLILTAAPPSMYSLSTSLQARTSLSLANVLSTYLPNAPVPSDLNIDNLTLTAHLGSSYAMSLALAQDPKPWVINLGVANITVSNVQLDLCFPKDGSTTGRIMGTLALDEGVELRINYALPGEVKIMGDLPEVSLQQLVSKLCDTRVPWPDNFDIVLTDSKVVLEKAGDHYGLALGTQVEGIGSLAFVLQKAGASGWGFAVGLDVSLAKVYELEGLKDLKVFMDYLPELRQVALVVSSLDSFSFPDLSCFDASKTTSTQIAVPDTFTPSKGISLYAKMAFSGKRELDMLARFLRLAGELELDVCATVSVPPAKNTRLTVGISGYIDEHGKISFAGQFYLAVISSRPTLGLSGALDGIEISGQKKRFKAELTVTTNGAYMAGSMTGGPIENLFGFQGLTVADLGLAIGVSFQGVPSFGLAGTLAVSNGQDNPIQSSIAILFDSGSPQHSVLAGSISDLRLSDLVRISAGAGSVSIPDEAKEVMEVFNTIGLKGIHSFEIPHEFASDLDKKTVSAGLIKAFQDNGDVTLPDDTTDSMVIVGEKDTKWFLTDRTTLKHYQLVKHGDSITVSMEPQLYMVPAETHIAGLHWPRGFRVSGKVEVVTFDAEAEVELSLKEGILAHGKMSKVSLFDQALEISSRSNPAEGPQLSIASFSRPNQPNLPDIQRKPHFFLDGELKFLGITDSRMYAAVSTAGVKINLDQKVTAIEYHLSCVLNSPRDFHGQGKAAVSLNTEIPLGPLGTIPLVNFLFNADLSFGLQNGNLLTSVAGAVDFHALGFDGIGPYAIKIPSLSVDVQPLLNLGGFISNEISKLASRIADDIVPDLWRQLVNAGKITGVIGRIMNEAWRALFESGSPYYLPSQLSPERRFSLPEVDCGLPVLTIQPDGNAKVSIPEAAVTNFNVITRSDLNVRGEQRKTTVTLDFWKLEATGKWHVRQARKWGQDENYTGTFRASTRARVTIDVRIAVGEGNNPPTITTDSTKVDINPPDVEYKGDDWLDEFLVFLQKAFIPIAKDMISDTIRQALQDSNDIKTKISSAMTSAVAAIWRRPLPK